MSVIRKHDRDLPRGWFNLFIRMGGWVCLIAGLIVAITFGITLATEQSAARFEAEGRVTWAEVTDKRVEISHDSDGDETRTYYVTFEFETRGGQSVRVERSVAKSFFNGTGPGDEKEIRYLPDVPKRIEYYVGEKAYRTRVGLWIGGVVGAIGLGMLWFAGGRTNRAILARRDGVKQVAEVLRVRRLKVEVNDVTQARLVWRGPDGKEGESLMRNYPDLTQYKPGDKITVFRRGDDVWWEGDVGPRKADMPPI